MVLPGRVRVVVMAVKFVDDLQTRITTVGGIAADALLVDITPGDGDKVAAFVDFGAGEYCFGTFKNTAGDRESVRITARDTDQLTIERAQDAGDSALSWGVDDILDFCLCQAALAHLAPGGQVVKTANYDLTVEDLSRQRTFTNVGAAAEVVLSLPDGFAGARVRFIVGTGHYLRVVSGASDRFRTAEFTGNAGGFVRSNVVGMAWDIEFVGGVNLWVIMPDGVPLLADE